MNVSSQFTVIVKIQSSEKVILIFCTISSIYIMEICLNAVIFHLRNIKDQKERTKFISKES